MELSLSRKRAAKPFFWRYSHVTLVLLQSRNDEMDRTLSLFVFSVSPHFCFNATVDRPCINFGSPKKTKVLTFFVQNGFFAVLGTHKRERFVRNKIFFKKNGNFGAMTYNNVSSTVRRSKLPDGYYWTETIVHEFIGLSNTVHVF